jgi:uncharacterized alkaline shock family protein YloU
MSEDRKAYMIKQDHLGEVRIADEVIAVIAALAATEVDGVYCLGSNISKEVISKSGAKKLSKGVRVKVEDNVISVDLALTLAYGAGIQKVTPDVQEKVKNTVENMTGLTVSDINVRIVGIRVEGESDDKK